MFQGLSNNDEKPAYKPDTVITITKGQFAYQGPDSVHYFGYLSGELLAADLDPKIGRVHLCFLQASGRKVSIVLPESGAQTLNLLLPLAGAKTYRGRRLDIVTTPDSRPDGSIRTKIQVKDGNAVLPAAAEGYVAPKTKEEIPGAVHGLVSDIRVRLAYEKEKNEIPRVAPDIDEVKEGL